MKRPIEISIEQAQQFYQQGGALKEIALLAFTEKELSEDINKKLHNLVGLRFTETELENKLNEIFGTEVDLHNEEYEEPNLDDCFFVSPNEETIYKLYYIETKDGKFYITEVAFE